jgi:hypothetical protein
MVSPNVFTPAGTSTTGTGAGSAVRVSHSLKEMDMRCRSDLARRYLVMHGYFDMPEATAEAIDGEGWLLDENQAGRSTFDSSSGGGRIATRRLSEQTSLHVGATQRKMTHHCLSAQERATATSPWPAPGSVIGAS